MCLLQLLILSSAAWCLAPATQVVEVICSEDALLTCTVPWNPQTPYTMIFWHKINEQSGELTKMLGMNLSLSEQFLDQKEINGSLEACPSEKCSLKIQNTTCQHVGTYRCTLWAPGEENSPSDTVELKVAGCTIEPEGDKYKKHRAEVFLLLFLAMFYVFLIVFTCKFARLQNIFPDANKQGIERTFLHVRFQNKKSVQQMGPTTGEKIDLV
ncbi:CD83 antigen isoform X1 [Vombatus ursinus]|uniref:Ig-like domain-containing protein n=1 Tax=Vombatus ursinus TaxID=29139 RepID=A0A4X2JVF7_VOMUR|nr:CD83 antigen isoform X1 [Vombatus ursinus]